MALVKLKTVDGEDLYVNPDEISRLTLVDAYRPGSGTNVWLKDGGKLRVRDDLDSVAARCG